VQQVTSTVDFTQVCASCSRSDRLIMGDQWRGEGHG